jgi:hypothetical protein
LPVSTSNALASPLENAFSGRLNQCAERLPLAQIPMTTCLSGRGGQHEKARLAKSFRLEAVGDSSTKKRPGGVLAGEGKNAGLVEIDLCAQRGYVECIGWKLVVVAGMAFGQVGEADTELGELREFRRLQSSRCQARLEQCAPEQVARVSVVRALFGRASACGSAAENECQARPQQVGKNGVVSVCGHARAHCCRAGNR